MLYSELESQILRNLGNLDDDDTKALVMTTFNFVQKLIARMGEWEELQVLVEGSLTTSIDTYQMISGTDPLNLVRPYRIYDFRLSDGTLNYSPLDFILTSTWNRRITPGTALTGTPNCYTRWGKVIKLFPTPDKAYSYVINYYQYPEVVLTAASVIQLEDLDQVLVAATTGYVWTSKEELKVASVWLKVANSMWKEFTSDNRSLPNFAPFGSSNNEKTGTYWSDPFQMTQP